MPTTLTAEQHQAMTGGVAATIHGQTIDRESPCEILRGVLGAILHGQR